MRHLLTLFLLTVGASACASDVVAGSDIAPILEASSEDHFDEARLARYNIEVYSGGGIPGTQGASFVVENYREVLQIIVDQCELGRTILVQATDGVSLLAILKNDLTDKQLGCIKEKEQPGVRLKDWGTNG